VISNLDESLVDEPDLGRVQRALVREQAIRDGMARTGEGREVVAEALDAMQSMDEEAVLELTEGAPTTLHDALTRYVRILEQEDELAMQQMGAENYRGRVVGDLDSILEYPWPAEEELLASHGINRSLKLDVQRTENDGALERVEVSIGGRFILAASSEHHTQAGLEAIASGAGHVHRAVLSRVIGDRDHHVQLNAAQVADLQKFLERPNGSATTGGRLTVNAVAGGGVLVRTRPYAYQHRVNEEIRREIWWR